MPATKLQEVVRRLEAAGLLLASDKEIPSVAGIVAGEPIRGSWWGHPKGNEIFNALNELLDRDDVLACKLVNGKVTLVTSKLWSPLLAVARSGEPWQWDGLDGTARRLHERVAREGELRTDELEAAERKAATVLEERLLLYSAQEHTESGHHARVLQSWDALAKARSFQPVPMSAADGKSAIETAAAKLSEHARLPWSPRRAKIKK